MILSKDERASLYNHQSVLENYHADKLISLLELPENDVFFNVSQSKRSELIEFMRDVILATDMTMHPIHMKTLRKTEFAPKSLRHSEDRIALLRVIMHACDLSGQVMTLPLALSWEERISAEMMNQVRKSQKLGIEVQEQHLQLEDMKARAEMQLGFIDNVLLPLWKETGRVFPSMNLFHLHLSGVIRSHYQILLEEGEEEVQRYDANYWDVQVLSYSAEV
mmetsp:Transcript_6857/g.7886  ORF Transcript_6857/g.7886 Transcript_6857/m.7886 type:complete len:221 (+) Transcript_6857:572-1234(+)